MTAQPQPTDAPQSRSAWLDHRIPPPVVGALLAAAMWGVSGTGPTLPIPDGPKLLLVLLLTGAGAAFDLLGLLAFRAARTTVNPLRPDRSTAIVSGGVYRVTRNPMYVGMALLLFAWAVQLSAVAAFAGPVVFMLYITRFQIRPEERALEQRFGDAYRRYASEVRRWL